MMTTPEISELTPALAEKLLSLCVFVDAEIQAQIELAVPERTPEVHAFHTEVQEAREWIETLANRVLEK